MGSCKLLDVDRPVVRAPSPSVGILAPPCGCLRVRGYTIFRKEEWALAPWPRTSSGDGAKCCYDAGVVDTDPAILQVRVGPDSDLPVHTDRLGALAAS